jgi:hypothetical protein
MMESFHDFKSESSYSSYNSYNNSSQIISDLISPLLSSKKKEEKIGTSSTSSTCFCYRFCCFFHG